MLYLLVGMLLLLELLLLLTRVTQLGLIALGRAEGWECYFGCDQPELVVREGEGAGRLRTSS